jgi:hypothetical protein
MIAQALKRAFLSGPRKIQEKCGGQLTEKMAEKFRLWVKGIWRRLERKL